MPSPDYLGGGSGRPGMAPLRLPGESRGPRPWGLGADVVSGFRRNDGWGGESLSPRPWGLGADVVSGFRRNDGWGGESRGPRPLHVSAISVVDRRPNSVSPAKAGVHVPGGWGPTWFPASAGMTGGRAKAGVHVPSITTTDCRIRWLTVLVQLRISGCRKIATARARFNLLTRITSPVDPSL